MFVTGVRLSILAFVLGAGVFVYYMRTRKRWTWAIAVTLMTLGGLGLSFWW